MAEITVSINRRQFRVMCRNGDEERVMRLAEDLAGRVAQIRKESGTTGAGMAGDSHLLVLAALTMLSELQDLQTELSAALDDNARADEARETLNTRIAELESDVVAMLQSAADRVDGVIGKIATEKTLYADNGHAASTAEDA